MKKILFVLPFLPVLSSFGFTPENWERHIPDGGLSVTIGKTSVFQKLTARGVACGGDGFVRADVPLYRRGTLDFDIRISPPERNRAMSHFLTLYGIRVFWHDACKDWRVYFPERNYNREQFFDDEPVTHRRIAAFSPEEWHHCRISFDAPGDRIEFFLDDMRDPAYVSGDRSVWGEAEFMGGSLCIGGMGGSRDSEMEIKNLVLAETTQAAASVARTETLVFNGMASDLYGVPEILREAKPRVYSLESTRANITAKNFFKYSQLPGRATIAAAKRIVLVDAPIDPDGILPPFLLDDIVSAVRDGAELVVLEGLFSMDRAGYAKSRLARILPEAAFAGTAFPARFTKPEIFEQAVGKGRVKVFRGHAFSADAAASRKAFAVWAEQIFR